jgi:hypothetical protein
VFASENPTLKRHLWNGIDRDADHLVAIIHPISGSKAAAQRALIATDKL